MVCKTLANPCCSSSGERIPRAMRADSRINLKRRTDRKMHVKNRNQMILCKTTRQKYNCQVLKHFFEYYALESKEKIKERLRYNAVLVLI